MHSTETKQCNCTKMYENIAKELDEQFELTMESNISGEALALYQQIYDNSIRLFTRVGFAAVRNKVTNKHTVGFVAQQEPDTGKTSVFSGSRLDVPKIESFKGEYFFLSNFYMAPVCYEGKLYSSNEAAFQAAKTFDINVRNAFTSYDPSTARKVGQRVELRPDWEEIKYAVMLDVVRDKFKRNPILADRLLATGDAYLEEGNTWGDRTWGTVNGQGKNWLGEILMKVRDELKNLDKA